MYKACSKSDAFILSYWLKISVVDDGGMAAERQSDKKASDMTCH